MTYLSMSVCPFFILFIGCIERYTRISLHAPLLVGIQAVSIFSSISYAAMNTPLHLYKNLFI